MYKRVSKKTMENWLDSREVLLLYGARQVGKTTFLHQFLSERNDAVVLNCEQNNVFDVLQTKNLDSIKFLFGAHKIVALDEAQSIPEIGKILKLIYDHLPQYKLIVTGSSSFELSSHVTEALTGRNVKFKMLPLSLEELSQKYSGINLQNKLNDLLVFGNYPGVVDLPTGKKSRKLMELTSDYLFKDVLIHESIKNPALLRKLLKMLAFQVGSQVSSNELSGALGVSRQTVDKYIDMLEKSFIIFRLNSYSSNLRNEIKKSPKYFFYDNGIRNAVIGDLSPIENRQDLGALWENFCITERMKTLYSKEFFGELYYWRTYDGAEIDLLEIENGKINCIEFKWSSKRKAKLPQSFQQKYKPESFKVISPANFYELMQ